ncbi:hypothetical protein FHW83_005957 [Duganella sp. SG902]|uniref:hypothetical protein n=1 Tax=Duganella sp. SG902 TaxID=2587016 RepID=UPI00159DC240|nr:hypothetical protein [Duganella sp. SG902]NVM80112.1 hypothetical protein [Duganella sp. SG902]
MSDHRLSHGAPKVLIAAERRAAEEIRAYIASGATEGLLAKEKGASNLDDGLHRAISADQGQPQHLIPACAHCCPE